MKQVLIFFILFFSLSLYSQNYHNFILQNIARQHNCIKTSMLSSNPETHNINITLLQYHQIQLRKFRMLTISPLRMVKFTLKAGFNGGIVSKINTRDLITGDFQDAFNEMEPQDALSIVKYDARLKVYLSKRWRLLMRAQVLGFGKNIYSAGFFWKV